MNNKGILVIKVGSSTLTKLDKSSERVIDSESFARIGKQIVQLQAEGYSIILVSSAAIVSGMAQVGMTIRPDKHTAMPELQRLASIGWRHVLNNWAEALGGRSVGELLLTKHELKTGRDEATELMRVMYALLLHGDIVIANENDAIAHSEIAFGDNDTLAAYIAASVHRSSLFDCKVTLLLLSDIDGVYQDINDPTSVIDVIDTIDKYSHLAGQSGTSSGTGGMATKFIAVTIAKTADVETFIGNGRADDGIARMLNRQIGTHFRITSL